MPYKNKDEYNAYMREYRKKRGSSSHIVNHKPVNHKPKSSTFVGLDFDESYLKFVIKMIHNRKISQEDALKKIKEVFKIEISS